MTDTPAEPVERLKAGIVAVTMFQQNCTLVWDDKTKQGVVVDPGGDLPRIREAIAKVGLKVEAILLTHGHTDHAGGAAELKEALGVEVIGPHIADKFLLDDLANNRFGVPARPITPDRWLAEGDTVKIAGRPFSILHCPGHSPGSVVFVSQSQQFALVGDVLFAGSIGRTDFPYGDHAALIDAITRKLLPLGDDIAFICGHGPTSTFGRERQTNPFLNA